MSWTWVAGAAALAAAGVWAARLLSSRGWGSCRLVDLAGRTAVVTGASSGLGRAAARHLAARGAKVVLACRDINAAAKVVDEVQQEYPRAQLMVMHLDLESFESIRSFVKQLKAAFAKIDILIDNAGVALSKMTYDITKEGHEMHFGVNHLGHFLLTNLILDLLEKGAPSRIVIVSSLLHERGEINFDDLNLRHTYDLIKAGDKKTIKKLGRHHPGYCNSKLMNVYFGSALAKLTKDRGIDVFTVCPGFTYTNLFRHALKWYHFVTMAPVFWLFMRSADQGVQTIMHCATDPSLQGKSGGFYRNCKPYVSKVILDEKTEEKLWTISEEIVHDERMTLRNILKS